MLTRPFECFTLWCLTSALAACGGGGSGATQAGAPITDTSSTLDVMGGTVALQGLSLTVPANALTGSTSVGLQQEAVASPALARFRFSPAGQALINPAELRYSAANLPANVRFFWEVNGEQWMIPGTVSGGVLTSTISSLGYAGEGGVRVAQAAGLSRALAHAGTRAAAQAGTAGEGGSLVVQPVDCDVHITALKLRLARAATDGDQDRAAGVFNDLQATREACAGVRVQEIERASCDALAVAQSRAQTVLADSLVTFNELTVPLHAAEAFVKDAGATCSNANPVANPLLINAKFDQLLNVMKGQMARAEFDDALTARDLRVVMHLDKMCQKLDLGAACDRLHTDLYPNLLDALRASAFEDCRANAIPRSVSQFYALGSQSGDSDRFFGHGRFSLADVEADLSYCGNPTLDLKVFPTDGPDDEITDRAATLTPLIAQGNYVNDKSIEVPREGSLEMSGAVGVWRCPDGSASGAELVARINGREWLRRPASGNLFPLTSGATLRLTVGNALPSLGIDPEGVDSFTVTINREGGGCSDGRQRVLDSPFTLFEVKVQLPGVLASGHRIAASDAFTCALNGSVASCWGLPLNLRRAADGNGAESGTPSVVAGLGSVRAIAAGSLQACAITATGAVKCWGYDGGGAALNGSTSPVVVTGLDGGVSVLSVGADYSCAVTVAGAAKCWGDNSEGQLGNGSVGGMSATPVGVTGLGSAVAAIRAGRRHSCALTHAGGVKCWGNNAFGQLGDGSTVNSPTPVSVTGLSSGVKAIAVGQLQTCALTARGAVLCWGANGIGQLGNGTSGNASAVPVAVSGLGAGVVAIAASIKGDHACALLGVGSVRCWGRNSDGQLGNGSLTHAFTPVEVQGLGSQAVEIAVGSRHSCAFVRGGGLKCWGANPAGQLGNGRIGYFETGGADSAVPVSVIGFP
jgi:alpha-tubulin suppressor-like RCC1 family protein